MIKINLALKKKAAGVEAGKAKEPLTLQNLKFDSAIFKEPQFRKLALCVFVAGMATYLLNGYEAEQLQKVDAQIAQVKAEGDRLQQDLVKTKSYDGLKKQLDSDEELIKSKLATIQKLSTDREFPSKLMLSLSNQIPKDVWLSELDLNATDLHIKGASLGIDQITDFMKVLSDNEYLSDLKMENTQKTQIEGTDVATFEFQAKRKQAQ